MGEVSCFTKLLSNCGKYRKSVCKFSTNFFHVPTSMLDSYHLRDEMNSPSLIVIITWWASSTTLIGKFKDSSRQFSWMNEHICGEKVMKVHSNFSEDDKLMNSHIFHAQHLSADTLCGKLQTCFSSPRRYSWSFALNFPPTNTEAFAPTRRGKLISAIGNFAFLRSSILTFGLSGGCLISRSQLPS